MKKVINWKLKEFTWSNTSATGQVQLLTLTVLHSTTIQHSLPEDRVTDADALKLVVRAPHKEQGPVFIGIK